MTTELHLRRKWTFRSHGQQVVFVKRPIEHPHHVWMKAFLWALYLPSYPTMKVEVSIGNRYKPDVVSLQPNDLQAAPLFWGEAGQVSIEKIHALLKRYPTTHFAIAKWETNLRTTLDNVTEAIAGLKRHGTVDILCFEAGSEARFIDERGNLTLTFADIAWQRIEGT